MGIHDGHREKMRRRFLETGLEGFADHEALELLLYYAIPRRDTNPIAHALMERYDSLSGVLNAPVEDLEKVEGIGESAAILLSLVSRLSRKARIADASQETILNSSERAGAYLLERFAGERRELVFLLCLDRKGRLLACKRLAEGDVASADLNIRKVVEMALLTSASAVILAHNHPSGVAVPSSSDEAATRQVAEALREDTVLVSVMLVNNELGSIYPIADIAKGLKAVNEKTLLHTDAVQGFLKVPFSAKALGADFIAISGHKVGAPKGIGALYIGPRVRNPRPLLPGGGQEMGLRSGTEATAQIAGFAKAVELRWDHLEDKLRHMAEVKAYAVEKLTARLSGTARPPMSCPLPWRAGPVRTW